MNHARVFVRGVLCFLVPIAFGACGDDAEAGTQDATSQSDGAADTTRSETGSDGTVSVTGCDFPYALVDGEANIFGEGCTVNEDCVFGVCMMPNAPGNITNTQFGFCSRGCDCENATDSQIPAGDKEKFDCLYPSGFVRSHHIVVECGNVSDCTALDPRWSDCKTPDTGGARKVCHAL